MTASRLKSLSTWMVPLALLGTAAYAVAEEVTLTTYYPSPRGVYSELRVTGSLGIGTATPSTQLEIYRDDSSSGGTAPYLRLTNPNSTVGDSYAIFESNAGPASGRLAAEGIGQPGAGWIPNSPSVVVGSASSHPLGLITGNTVKMVVDPSGNVGIGTTSPTAKLDVNGLIKSQGNVVPYIVARGTYHHNSEFYNWTWCPCQAGETSIGGSCWDSYNGTRPDYEGESYAPMNGGPTGLNSDGHPAPWNGPLSHHICYFPNANVSSNLACTAYCAKLQ